MDNFNNFFKTILKNSKLNLNRDLSLAEIRFIISKLNEYLYTNYEGIGYADALDDKFEYFSEFHKFWEKYHKEILNPKIDEKQCKIVADILHDVYLKYGDRLFYELYDTGQLKPEEICRIRYFSANQDFRGSRDFSDLIEKFKDDPTIFDTRNIFEHPEDFLKNIGITALSQSDKRIKYAITAAKILLDNNIEPHQLIKHCSYDLLEVRKLMLGNRGSGFGKKKTDMFLRDMIVLKVWKKIKNFDKIDVASDVNTIKVALRTRILKTDIVLISSFLDIFCYQYGLIDEMNALAWRRVWGIWHEKYPKECIDSPCLIDYFVYRVIGKDFCRELLCIFKCEAKNHIFKWHSSRNQTCHVCFKNNKIKNKARLVKKVLPCTDKDGYIAIEKSEFVEGKGALLFGIKECPFVKACNSKSPEFKKLNPPKSISILGQTGWESARVRVDAGGGGLMS
jgi:hypothetical protein